MGYWAISEQKVINHPHPMQSKPGTMKRTAEGVRIHAPRGDVLLRSTPRGIEASYQSGPLVNGSATVYAQQIAREAVEQARQRPLPWSTDDTGQILVNEPQRFYRETFDPEVWATETLRHWEIHQGATTADCSAAADSPQPPESREANP